AIKDPRVMAENGLRDKVLSLDSMNPWVKRVEYAVRGPVLVRAVELEEELRQGVKKPFTEVIKANIGDAHAMASAPSPSCCQVHQGPGLDPGLGEQGLRVRSEGHRQSCGGGSPGLGEQGLRVRTQVTPGPCPLCAAPAHPSLSPQTMLKLLVSGEGQSRTGVMIPIPQYPLYSAGIAELNAVQVNYYLDEEHCWALDVGELRRALRQARGHCQPRVLCIINPGNPTGTTGAGNGTGAFVLQGAPAPIQTHVYAEGVRVPYSFKERSFEMAHYSQSPSLHLSPPRCGLRGGYMEVVNLDPAVQQQLSKLVSVRLCPPVPGQVLLDVVMNPPKPGEPSYQSFIREKQAVLSDLAHKAQLTQEIFSQVPGIHCNPVQGAMYSFPRIQIPARAVQEAQVRGFAPDMFFCLQLLEETGICVVPGSGFGEREGTYHFRMTILPHVEKLRIVLKKLSQFYAKFIQEYS
uniref:alanine transaminase n=1 Tax=Chelonoidis abingdonii TaxID=106734 RepID=A0A8C0H3L0_CHEAB